MGWVERGRERRYRGREGGEREGVRQTDRKTDRQREPNFMACLVVYVYLYNIMTQSPVFFFHHSLLTSLPNENMMPGFLLISELLRPDVFPNHQVPGMYVNSK